MRLDRCVFTIYMYDQFHGKIWPVCVYYIHDFVWPIPLWDLTGLCVRYTWMAEYWRLCHWPIYWHSPMLSRDHRSKLVRERLSPKISKKKLFLKTRARTLPPSPVKKMIVTRSATISTTLLFWFISVCISIFLYTFQCSYKRIDILVCFWISFYVCHFSKR